MGCCAFNNLDSKQLYIIRYGQMETTPEKNDHSQLARFESQIQDLEQIRIGIKGFINTLDFSEEEYIETCQSFLQRYHDSIKSGHDNKFIDDMVVIENVKKIRDFVLKLVDTMGIQETKYADWFEQYQVQNKELEQDTGLIGEFKRSVTSEQNLIIIFQILEKFDQEQITIHQSWLQNQIQLLKERLLVYTQQIVLEYSRESVKILEKDELYENLYKLKQEKGIKQVEFWGYRVMQQLVELKQYSSDSMFKSEILTIATDLEKLFTTLYMDNIIKVYQLLLDDYLIQEEIELASMTTILEGFELKSMEIFQEEFYVFHIHQAEKCILQMKKLSENFDQYFTKFQVQHFLKQKKELDIVLKECLSSYQLSMKKISQMIAGQVDDYFQRCECMKIILNVEKRQERKLQVFIQTFGEKVNQDIVELKQNSQKFLDLQGLRLNHNAIEIKQMIVNYEQNLKNIQLTFYKWVNTQMDSDIIELQKIDENQEKKLRIEKFIKETDNYISLAKLIKINVKDIDKLEQKIISLLDSMIYTKERKNRVGELSQMASRIKTERKSALNSPISVSDKESNGTMQGKFAIFQSPKSGANNNKSTIKLIRFPMSIISLCGKCNNQTPYRMVHKKCQTNFFLDMNGFLRCEKRLASNPQQKVCSLKSIFDYQFTCPYCKTKFNLKKFNNFLKAIIKGVNLQELAVDSKDVLALFKKIYEDFSILYYKFMLRKLNICEIITEESQEI